MEPKVLEARQCQIGAGALRELGVHRIGNELWWRPQRGCPSQFAALEHRVTTGRKLIDRHHRSNGGSLGNGHPCDAGDAVVAETRREQVRSNPQRISLHGIATDDDSLTGIERQRTTAVEAVTANHAVENERG